MLSHQIATGPRVTWPTQARPAPTGTPRPGRVRRDPAAGEVLDLRPTPGRVLKVLVACIAVLVAAGAAVAVARAGFGYRSLYGLGPLFDLDHEGSVPSFFSALLLLLAAVLLGVIAMERDPGRPGRSAHWTLLAAGFLLLAFDEAVAIHERLNRPVRELLDAPGFATAWLVPAAVVLVALAVFYLPFLRALPRRYAAMFLGCGLLYVSGTVIIEGAGTLLAGGGGKRVGGDVYSAFVVVEEACEMLGIALFIYCLLLFIAERGVEVRVRAPAAAAGGGPAAAAG